MISAMLCFAQSWPTTPDRLMLVSDRKTQRWRPRLRNAWKALTGSSSEPHYKRSPLVRMPRDVAIASATRNFSDQALGLESVEWRPGATILDIGCGPGVHLEFFRSKGLIGTGLDLDAANFLHHGEIEHVTDMAHLRGRKFDYVFASHVLEHCPNTFETLAEWSELLVPGGVLIIFVPPFWNEISNDHWCTGFNVGQLAMSLVASGFDCSRSTFYETKFQVFGFGVKTEMKSSGFRITESLPYLPSAMADGFHQGVGYQNLRADISFVHGDRIEYLPRRSSEMALPLPDSSWLRVINEGWQDAMAQPLEPIDPGGDYVLAIKSDVEGYIRICFGYDDFVNRAEFWLELKPGLNIRQFIIPELFNRTDGFEPTKTQNIVIGGPDPFVCAALFQNGRRVV